MTKYLEWPLVAGFGLAGLLASLVVTPTVLECRLFTACHELNLGFALISIFSTEISSTLAHERTILLIAHGAAFALIGAVVGLTISFAIRKNAAMAHTAVQYMPPRADLAAAVPSGHFTARPSAHFTPPPSAHIGTQIQ